MKITLNELRQIVKSIIKEEMTAGNPTGKPKLTADQVFKNLFEILYASLGSYVTVRTGGTNKIVLQSGGQNIITIEVDSDGGGRLYLGDLYKSKQPIQNFWARQTSMSGAVKSYTKPDIYNIRVETPEIIKDTLLTFFKQFDPKNQTVASTMPNYQKK
jgi:hypothetical protein